MSGDMLDGGPGNDTLAGGFGADEYVGGAGDDTISPNWDDPGDTVSCGDGADLVDGPGLGLLRPDCELIQSVYTQARAYPRRPTASELRFTVYCPVAGHRCTATVRLKLLGRRRAFAIGRFAARRGVLRPRFVLPPYVTDSRRSPLPVRVIVQGDQRQPRLTVRDFDAQWVFDVSATPVSA